MTTEPMIILLAEDDEGHAELIRMNLERAGIVNPIVHMRDGQAALNFIHGDGATVQRSPHQQILLLLDNNMPRVDGIEVLRRVKAEESTAHLPVIMLTTTDDPREIERCYQLGCNVYVTKPVEYDRFIEAVQRLGLFLQVVRMPPVTAPVLGGRS